MSFFIFHLETLYDTKKYNQNCVLDFLLTQGRKHPLQERIQSAGDCVGARMPITGIYFENVQ